MLSAFLRLAETLDRSRHGVIRGLEVRERLGEIRIKVQAVGDAELEVWAAHRQAAALEEALDRKVRHRKSAVPQGPARASNSELARRHATPGPRQGARRRSPPAPRRRQLA